MVLLFLLLLVSNPGGGGVKLVRFGEVGLPLLLVVVVLVPRLSLSERERLVMSM